jgi:hypothetical protein
MKITIQVIQNDLKDTFHAKSAKDKDAEHAKIFNIF